MSSRARWRSPPTRRTNALVITSSAHDYAALRPVIDMLDVGAQAGVHRSRHHGAERRSQQPVRRRVPRRHSGRAEQGLRIGARLPRCEHRRWLGGLGGQWRDADRPGGRRAGAGHLQLAATGRLVAARLRRRDQRARELGRCQHPVDAALDRDRQRGGRDQRRSERAAADVGRELARRPGRPGRAGCARRRQRRRCQPRRGARCTGRPGRARRLRRRAAPGRRHDRTDHAAHQRERRDPSRDPAGDLVGRRTEQGRRARRGLDRSHARQDAGRRARSADRRDRRL